MRYHLGPSNKSACNCLALLTPLRSPALHPRHRHRPLRRLTGQEELGHFGDVLALAKAQLQVGRLGVLRVELREHLVHVAKRGEQLQENLKKQRLGAF